MSGISRQEAYKYFTGNLGGSTTVYREELKGYNFSTAVLIIGLAWPVASGGEKGFPVFYVLSTILNSAFLIYPTITSWRLYKRFADLTDDEAVDNMTIWPLDVINECFDAQSQVPDLSDVTVAKAVTLKRKFLAVTIMSLLYLSTTIGAVVIFIFVVIAMCAAGACGWDAKPEYISRNCNLDEFILFAKTYLVLN